MTKFEEKKFNIPELKGISAKTIEEHLKLYSGYVKHANLIQSMIAQYGKVDAEDGKYSVSEITRRFSFEYNGMRNHEVYFSHFEGGAKPLSTDSELMKAGLDIDRLKTVALTRGIGWAMLFWDQISKSLITQWVDEQHLGQLNGCQTILALDMWEHSFVADYQPSGKKQYVEDFFANLNWENVEANFARASSGE